MADHWPAVRAIYVEEQAGFRLLGRRKRIRRWRIILLLERRNTVVGTPNAVGA